MAGNVWKFPEVAGKLFSDFPPNLSDFPHNIFISLKLKIRNNIETRQGKPR